MGVEGKLIFTVYSLVLFKLFTSARIPSQKVQGNERSGSSMESRLQAQARGRTQRCGEAFLTYC